MGCCGSRPDRTAHSGASTQDNYGKLYFQGGSSGMPGYFQFPVHYGKFATPDQFEPDLNILWGAPILTGDIQAGTTATRASPDGSLIYATAAAGNVIYRGDRLPKDLIGDYFYGEVVGRIVRRLQTGQRPKGSRSSETSIRGPSSSDRSTRCSGPST